MAFKIVFSKDAPEPIGPYSQGIDTGNFVFTAGQIGISRATGELVRGGISAETHQVFKNLQAILEAAGSSLNKVVKVTVYLSNLEDFPTMNEVYKDYFAKNPAARTTVGANLPKGAKVEIDVVAEK